MAAISQAVANYKVTAGAKGCRGGGRKRQGSPCVLRPPRIHDILLTLEH